MSYQIDSPVFINTRFNYFCDNCVEIEPKIITDTITANGEKYCVSHTLTCENYETCRTLMHNLRYKQKAERKEE